MSSASVRFQVDLSVDQETATGSFGSAAPVRPHVQFGDQLAAPGDKGQQDVKSARADRSRMAIDEQLALHRVDFEQAKAVNQLQTGLRRQAAPR